MQLICYLRSVAKNFVRDLSALCYEVGVGVNLL